MIWIRAGAFAMALGVLLGAFGAHGLRGRLSPDLLDIYKTGVLYHLVHALGLLCVGILCQAPLGQKYSVAGLFMTWGIVLFSGSLYLLALTGLRWLGAITPLGGLCFIAGWSWVLVKTFR